MTRIVACLAISLIIVTSISFAQASEWHVDRSYDRNSVQFTSEVLGFSFSGKTKVIDGFIYSPHHDFVSADAAFYFEVDLTDIDSGIGRRDRDMRKILETAEWPKATFAGKISHISPDSLKRDRYELTASGKLKIKGIEKNLDLVATLDRHTRRLIISANFPVRLNDYKIAAPTLAAFIKVSEIIEMDVQFAMASVVREKEGAE